MPGHRLTRAAHTVIIRSIMGTASSLEPWRLHIRKSIGRIPDRIEYFLRRRPITLSTCILTLAIPLVRSTSTGSSWSFPLLNAGIANYDGT